MRHLTLAAAMLIYAAMATASCAEPPATQPAKEMTLDLGNNLVLKLVQLPAGKFQMGSPQSEKDREDRNTNETQHEVTISKPFYMGETHVTVDQYAQFIKYTGRKHDAPSFKQAGDHPAVNISWDDAQAFVGWLSKRSGKTVILPTEAQWEYACRAGTTSRFNFGDKDSDLNENAWYSGNSGKTTHSVAQKRPNAFGLYDMAGNAFQWCQDHYDDYDAAAATDPTGPATGGTPGLVLTGSFAGTYQSNLRVLRGGAWDSVPSSCRSAYRHWSDPDQRAEDFGFRVAVIGP